MRLIDADKLISHLNDYALQESPSDVDSPCEQKISTAVYKAIQNCINAVKEQPAAYDPDKVVKQLENKMQTHKRCIEYEKKNGTVTEEFQQRKAVEVLEDAIKIVKGGGVDAEH